MFCDIDLSERENIKLPCRVGRSAGNFSFRDQTILRKPVEASIKKEILLIAFNRNKFCVLTQKIAFKRKQHCD